MAGTTSCPKNLLKKITKDPSAPPDAPGSGTNADTMETNTWAATMVTAETLSTGRAKLR